MLAAMKFNENRRILYAAPTQDQTDAFWEACKNYFWDYIEIGEVYKNETRRILETRDARIRAKTAWDADTLRGDYADLSILEEYALMKPSTWDEVGAPMLLDNDGDAVFIFTPKRRNHAFELYTKAISDMSGRWVDAFVLARLMTGLQISDSEQCMKEYMLKHQRDDGLFYNEPCQTAAVIKIGNIPAGAFADMFCQSRVLLGLVSWYLEEPTSNLEERIERLLKGLKRVLVWDGPSCRAPALRWLEEGKWQSDGGFEDIASGYAATMTPMIMRYYEATESPLALRVAQGLVCGFVLDRSRYAADGTYAGNTHWGGGCLGPAGAVRLARVTSDEELLTLCEKIFQHVKELE